MGINISKCESWCIEQHAKTNHFYDKYLPYSFHLRMVNTVANDFKHLLSTENDYDTGKTFNEFKYNDQDEFISESDVVMCGTYGHDLIEDARKTWSDIQREFGNGVADLVYALSNEKGKTREERANLQYYIGIRRTKGAVFVKLCDRIANVQYGKMTKSNMVKKYEKENPHFMKMLGRHTSSKKYEEMFIRLENLFQE
jgi:(p)ppGpp synthase/HD superfamily hydrolase